MGITQTKFKKCITLPFKPFEQVGAPFTLIVHCLCWRSVCDPR